MDERDEFLIVIGELYISRGRLKVAHDQALKQIDEMANVITDLREKLKNGELVESNDNHELRRIR